MKFNFSAFTGKKQVVLSSVYIVLGSIVTSLAYPLFLLPNSIPPGGLTGVATILNALFDWPVGLVSLILNIPLFLVGYKAMGKTFAFRSLVATVIFSFLIDFFATFLPPLADDLLLGSVFGGGLLGLGLGLILKGGATTGGTDMIARMLHHKLPIISVGGFLFIADLLVVIAAGVFVDGQLALYALICIFVTSKAIDMVLEGLSSAKSCYVITEKWEVIAKRIMDELDRGVTYVQATGAYTGENRPIVLCVASIEEVPQIKNIVSQEDEKAFMFINDAREALGEGFKDFSANV